MPGTKTKKTTFPFLPIRDIVLFPYMMIPLAVGRKKSLKAVETASENDDLIIIGTQKDIYKEFPTRKDLYDTVVVARVVQLMALPDESKRVLVECKKRAILKKLSTQGKTLKAEIDIVEEPYHEKTSEVDALMRRAKELFSLYIKLKPETDFDSISIPEQIEEPSKFADTIAGYLIIPKKQAQKLLDEFDPLKRLNKLLGILEKEVEVLKIKRDLENKVKKRLDKSQKEYFLSEQMKAIKEELGKSKNDAEDELSSLESKINKKPMSAEAKKQAKTQLGRLKKMLPFSPEATVIRTYLEWLLKLPWDKKTKDNINLKNAEKILEKEHYGLSDAKERIIEYLAVSKLSKRLKTPILCFVGPPGTGKTSFGRSIAHALERKFARISLGGVRDEAEIRGHRRTYIGSMPGRLIQSIARVNAKNPVLLLDEIDKMGKDFRGDPASAMLEALDPEQNKHFSDHFLEVAFDLSDVMFITTANTTSTIPPSLLDRMEIIKFSGYTIYEKLNIARKFIIPKQLIENGLKNKKVKFSDGALKYIISNYTKEAGVRNLEREIAGVLRKVARQTAEGKLKNANINMRTIKKYLTIPKFSYSRSSKNDIGVASGLSWTENGGESLSIEVSLMPGKGKLKMTGALGDIMKESAQAALSYVRANTSLLKIDRDFYKKNDIHIHVPAGAVPKEGPSAGITICTA
ncbi:MAG: endopeptidase La, partial [Elusimicrobiota bacterium]